MRPKEKNENEYASMYFHFLDKSLPDSDIFAIYTLLCKLPIGIKPAILRITFCLFQKNLIFTSSLGHLNEQIRERILYPANTRYSTSINISTEFLIF